jgi:hypothetical protein
MFDAPQPVNNTTAIIAVPQTFNFSDEHQPKKEGRSKQKTLTAPDQAATVRSVRHYSK